jgi:hypothetical protein
MLRIHPSNFALVLALCSSLICNLPSQAQNCEMFVYTEAEKKKVLRQNILANITVSCFLADHVKNAKQRGPAEVKRSQDYINEFVTGCGPNSRECRLLAQVLGLLEKEKGKAGVCAARPKIDNLFSEVRPDMWKKIGEVLDKNGDKEGAKECYRLSSLCK